MLRMSLRTGKGCRLGRNSGCCEPIESVVLQPVERVITEPVENVAPMPAEEDVHAVPLPYAREDIPIPILVPVATVEPIAGLPITEIPRVPSIPRSLPLPAPPYGLLLLCLR